MPASSSLVQDFLRHAALAPDRDAVVTADRRITFAALARAAGGVQQALARTDPLRGPVAILATDAVDRAAAVLGVIATGRAFVLLDPERSDGGGSRSDRRPDGDRGPSTGIVRMGDPAG